MLPGYEPRLNNAIQSSKVSVQCKYDYYGITYATHRDADFAEGAAVAL